MSEPELFKHTEETLPVSPLLHESLRGVDPESLTLVGRMYAALHFLGMQTEEDMATAWPGVDPTVEPETIQMLRACADGLAVSATPRDPGDVTGLRALGERVYAEVRRSLAS